MFTTGAHRPTNVVFPGWGVFIFESHHSARFHMPPTSTDYLKVVYVLKGRGKVVGKDLRHSVPIQKGDLIVVSPQMLHTFHDDPTSRPAYIVLCVRRDALKTHSESLWKLGRPCMLRNDALTQEADRLLRQIFFEQFLRRTACAEMMIGLTVQLLAVIARQRQRFVEQDNSPTLPVTSADARVHAYIQNLADRYFENEKIDSVAARLGMSRRSFTWHFRRLAGKSWLSYVREIRLRHAKALLLSSDHTTLWVALECGFQDLSTFYRTFRNAEGITPLQWKEAHQKKRSSPGQAARAASAPARRVPKHA